MKERDGERIQNLNSDGTGVLIDLSTSGVAMLLPVAKENGFEVVVYINELKIKSKVIYSIAKEEKFRIGLHFLSVTPDKKTILSDLIDKFSKGVPLKCVLEDAQSKA